MTNENGKGFILFKLFENCVKITLKGESPVK